MTNVADAEGWRDDVYPVIWARTTPMVERRDSRPKKNREDYIGDSRGGRGTLRPREDRGLPGATLTTRRCFLSLSPWARAYHERVGEAAALLRRGDNDYSDMARPLAQCC